MEVLHRACSCSGLFTHQPPAPRTRTLPPQKSCSPPRRHAPCRSDQCGTLDPREATLIRAEWRQRDSAGAVADVAIDDTLSALQQAVSSREQLAGSSFLAVACSTALALLCLPEAAWAFPGVTAPVPLQILGFLLNHPVITLVIAGIAIWAIPRLARAAVRFILIPAGLLGLAYLVITNPQTSFSFAGTTLSCESHPQVHPVTVFLQ